MCGIAGYWTLGKLDPGLLIRMEQSLAHRGPDDHTTWSDPAAGIGFAHRRLAIVDLSPSGRQPMTSSDGRWVLSFNGEIYNHADLRAELESVGKAPHGGWRGHSDTEVLTEAIAAWGLEVALERSVGMFAMTVWDHFNRELHLARDRFGEKPLYYGWAGRDFLFASELKAMRAHPAFDNAIDRRALTVFASRTYIPEPLSIYVRAFKLPPGCVLSLKGGAAFEPRTEPPEEGTRRSGLKLHRYWSYRAVVQRGLANQIHDEEEALPELERTLAAAISAQSIADVPIGAFLSGGIDSSTVVALCQKYSSTPVHTFSIGFEEAGFNEAKDAKRVADYVGTVHHEHYVTVQEARGVIPLLPSMYDEPFADSSQIPTYLVSRFAREQVAVALTGDGGDELFAGYNRHVAAPTRWQQLQRIPKPLRSIVGQPLGRVPSDIWTRLGLLIPGRRQPHFGAKAQKAFRVAATATSIDDVYCSFLDEWSFEQPPVLGGTDVNNNFDLELCQCAPDALRIMYCDAVSYLPDDILAKVDRASMAVSLETRVPFLDHRVAELAARIPLSLKVENGKGKHILRKLLYGLVPENLVDRPKSGFGVPVGEWIKGPLRPWAEDLLDPRRMAQDGWFNPAIVQRRWQAHLSGRRDSTPALWAILMFQAWLRQQSQTCSKAA